MQRGWRWTHKSANNGLQASPLTPTIWQKVGTLAQQGVYEFHQDPLLLKHPRGCEQIADRLYLYYEMAVVRDRVMKILQQYQAAPWLLGQDLIVLNRGDEAIPPPIEIQVADQHFHLFAAFDCIVRLSADRLEIIDFKTGLADFDARQADVYLLACSYLYPNFNAVASFYNLETMTRSESISATPQQLEQTALKLAQIAKIHQQQLEDYQSDPDSFDRLFPPHPGHHCRSCSFNYRCTYATAC